jgi:hypothetical protein
VTGPRGSSSAARPGHFRLRIWELRDYLIELAIQGRTESYTEVAQRTCGLRSYSKNPQDCNLFTHMLWDISTHEAQQGRAMRSENVCQKGTDTPGENSVPLAIAERRFDPERESERDFLKRERQELREYWSKH